MEMSWGVVALVSPPQHQFPAMLMTISMLIWGSVGWKAHLLSLYLITLLTPLLFFFTASPHTWHAAHMKRAQSLLTFPPSLTITLFLYFAFLHVNFCFHCINVCNALLNITHCYLILCARPGIEITRRAHSDLSSFFLVSKYPDKVEKLWLAPL